MAKDGIRIENFKGFFIRIVKAIAISYSGATGKYQYYLNGSLMGTFEPASSPAETAITSLTFDIPVDYFAYCMIDELRISNAALYTEDYTPASAPFDIPMALVLPSEKTEGAIAVKSAVTVNNVRLGGVRPSYPAQVMYIFLLMQIKR